MEELWRGSNALLLNEYFDDKQNLADKKQMKRYLAGRTTDTLNKEIRDLEIKIMEFVSSLDNKHLKSLIYMSLDINAIPKGWHFEIIEE